MIEDEAIGAKSKLKTRAEDVLPELSDLVYIATTL